jgi:hypothetical protein
MASGMEKNPVVSPITTAVSLPNNVVVMPTREFGDFLVADRTYSILFFPEAQELPPLSEIISHLEAKSLLKIDFPGSHRDWQRL